MDARAYEMMAETEERHWWWAGRRAILAAVLDELRSSGGLPPGTLYDLGCGVGSNLPVLRKLGPTVGLDGSPLAVACAHRRGRTDVRLAELSLGIDAVRDVPAHGASVVLLADVLEHLDDERPALEVARHLLAPAGALIVTVPALPWLWSPSDVFNHHRRRYTRAGLRQVIAPRFRVSRLTYFNSLLFPPIALARALANAARRPGQEEIGLPPRPVNAVLRRVLSAEATVLRRHDLPVGVSLLCVARPLP